MTKFLKTHKYSAMGKMHDNVWIVLIQYTCMQWEREIEHACTIDKVRILYFCSFCYFVWVYCIFVHFFILYEDMSNKLCSNRDIKYLFPSSQPLNFLNWTKILSLFVFIKIYMYECVCIMNVTGIINHYLNTRTFTTSLNQKVSNSSVLQTSFNMSILDGAMCNIVNRIFFHKIDSLMLIIIWSNLKFQIHKL